jgi:hypothetical protein
VIALGGIPGARLRSTAPPTLPEVPADTRDRDGVVDVTVRDSPGGHPLAKASVRIFAIMDDRAYLGGAGETPDTGLVRFARLPHGEVWILAEAPHHARGSAHIIVGGEPRTLVIDLAPAHSLRVAVHDELGAPLDGAEIEVLSATDPLPVGARSDAGGGAQLGRLGEGPWHVTARAPGFDDSSVRAQHEGEAVNIVLRKLGTLAVHVVRSDGRDADRASVAVAGAHLWPPRSTETDAHGDVRIAGLAAGTYALRATKGDAVSPIELGVSLERGQDKSVVLRLMQGHFVRVRVTDGEGEDAEPVAAARVTLAEGGLSPFPLEATTDRKGFARLGPVASGRASVGVRADGFIARGAVAVSDPPAPETRVALVRAGALIGRVLDTRGDPVDGATIEITGTDPSGGPILDEPRRVSFQTAYFEAMLPGPSPLVASGELGVMPGPVPPIPVAAGFGPPPAARPAVEGEPWVTRDDGTFRAAPASPGRIRAFVRHPQYVEAQSDVVTLLPGGEAHVDVVMHRGGTLEGRVMDARDRPVASVRVFVSATHGMLERMTRTASDGTFAFAALPSSVSLTTSSDDEDTPDVRTGVEIPEGGRREVTVHLPAARSPLVVTVVDDRGAPVSTAQVTARSLSVEAPLRVTAFTDAQGAAVLKRASGIPLRVEATAPSRAPRAVVTDGGQVALRIELAPAETLTGEVVASRGRDPIAGASVTLESDLGSRRTHADEKGHFAIKDLPHGAARLIVRARGFAPAARSIALPDSGGRREFALGPTELMEEGIVEGDVVDARGGPVPGVRVAQGHAPTWLLVGSTPADVAVTDAKGHFVLRELAEGTISLEAYSPDLGRGNVSGVRVVAGRTTDRIDIVIEHERVDAGSSVEPSASGGVAVTLGESGNQVIVMSVVEGSEAERAGVTSGDVLIAVDDLPVSTIEQARTRLNGPITDDVVLRLQRADREVVLRVARDAVRR